MNFKKIKESLISAVLGSSLFLVNGGVICQQPRAWLSDGFIDSETKKYAHNPKMTKIIKVLKFFSDLHEKPEYAGALSYIYKSSLFRLKDLTPVRKSAETTEFFQFLFTEAMVAATADGPVTGSIFTRPDGTDVHLTMARTLELLCLCSECSINLVTTILQKELELIFPAQQITDPNEMNTLTVGQHGSYCLFYNSQLGNQLKDLLTSAIELLSK